VDGQPAFPTQEQVLAVGVDRRNCPAGEAFGPAVQGVARLRRANLVGDAPLEQRADAPRCMVNGVAFRN
jgi:hypothetical protein